MRVSDLVALLLEHTKDDPEVWAEYPDMGFDGWVRTKDVKAVVEGDGSITFVVADGNDDNEDYVPSLDDIDLGDEK